MLRDSISNCVGPSVGRSVCLSVGAAFPFSAFCKRFCITAPAQSQATDAVVYTALFFFIETISPKKGTTTTRYGDVDGVFARVFQGQSREYIQWNPALTDIKGPPKYICYRRNLLTLGTIKMADFCNGHIPISKWSKLKKIMTLGKLCERSFIQVKSEICSSSSLEIRGSQSKMPRFQTSLYLTMAKKDLQAIKSIETIVNRNRF